jgi:hypothetical protein
MSANNQETPNLAGIEKHEPTLSPLASKDSSSPDLPSTLTEAIYRNGQEHILLNFVGGGKKNPFNWSVARKAFITLLLCLMTLFIGLQQQHTAVKLMAWWKALGYDGIH